MGTDRVRYLDLRNPEGVKEPGIDHGGPLKLHHRAEGPGGEFLIVKWPSYSHWVSIMGRASNKTTYWLLRVDEHDPEGPSLSGEPVRLVGRVKVTELEEVEPGRRRSLVKALVEKCNGLAGG